MKGNIRMHTQRDTYLEVGHDDGHLRAGRHQDERRQEEEACSFHRTVDQVIEGFVDGPIQHMHARSLNRSIAKRTEEVEELVQPEGRHDEEELHRHGAEGEDAGEDDHQHRVHVPGLRGDAAAMHVMSRVVM